MLFMGEEWGASTPWQFFTSHPEPELGEATAEGASPSSPGWAGTRRRARPAGPGDVPTLEARLGRTVRAAPCAAPDLVPALIELRRTVPAFTDPAFADTTAVADESTDSFVLRRGSATLAVNFGTEAVELPLRVDDLLDSFGEVVTSDGSIRLGAHSVAILHH